MPAPKTPVQDKAKPAPPYLRLAIFIACGAVVLALAIWTLTLILRPAFPSHSQVVAEARTQAALTGGAQAFATHCAACHAVGIGPSITGRSELDAPTITAFVRSGPGAMPAFPTSQVSDADIAAIADWLKDQPPTSSPEAAK